MGRRAPLLALVLLAGCAHWYGPHRPASADERGYVEAARAAYTAARGPVACPVLDRVELVTVAGETSPRSEEHTSELQSHSFISYAVFCLEKKNNTH